MARERKDWLMCGAISPHLGTREVEQQMQHRLQRQEQPAWNTKQNNIKSKRDLVCVRPNHRGEINDEAHSHLFVCPPKGARGSRWATTFLV